MATTSILPLTLGQAVLGRVVEPDGPAPDWLRIDGECWKLVTDPEAVAAAQAAVEARERADTAFALAQYAPRIASRPPVLDDAAGKAPGAGWLEYDPATQLLKQMWRWTGELWEPLPMDPVMIPVIQIGSGTAGDLTADRVIVTGDFVARVAQILQLSVENLVVTEGATINELVALAIASATADFQEAYIQNLRSNGAVIDEAVIGDLASNIITSGLFRTAQAGQRLEIDSNGLVMWGLDPDGLEYEMVRLGPTDGENLLTIGDTVITPTSIDAPEANFEQLTVGGQSVAEILDEFPRGVVARGWNDVSGRTIGPVGYTELGEITVPVENGRAYALKVEPISAYPPRGGRLALHMYLEKGIGGASAPAPTLSSRLYRSVVFRDSGGDRPMVVFQGNWLMWEDEGSTEWRILFVVEAYDSTDSGAIYAAQRPASGVLAVSVEDVGPHKADIMADRTGTTAAPKPPPPVAKRYTKTYTSTGFETYDHNGSKTSDTDVVQGLYAGGPTRLRRRGGWKFPSMTGDLSGATIEKVEMYIYLKHSYYTAGATVNPAVHNGNIGTSLSAFTSVYNWKRNTGKWITIKPEYHAGFKSGTYKGVGVISTNTYAEQYARFNGSGAKIRITYVK